MKVIEAVGTPLNYVRAASAALTSLRISGRQGSVAGLSGSDTQQDAFCVGVGELSHLVNPSEILAYSLENAKEIVKKPFCRRKVLPLSAATKSVYRFM